MYFLMRWISLMWSRRKRPVPGIFIFFFVAAVKKHTRVMLMQGSNSVRRKPAPEKITETAWRCASWCLSCTKCWDLFIYDRVSPPHYLKWKSNSMCLQGNAPLFMQQTYKNRDGVLKNIPTLKPGSSILPSSDRQRFQSALKCLWFP